MNHETYQAVLACYNHHPATVGRGWDRRNTGDTAYQFKIFDDFYYQLFRDEFAKHIVPILLLAHFLFHFPTLGTTIVV